MSPPVLDPVALGKLAEDTGADPAMLDELVRDFLRDAARLWGDVRHAAGQGRLPEAARAAHTLKSLSATFGAHALSASCRRLEERLLAGLAPDSGDLAEAEGALAALQQAHGHVLPPSG